MNILTKRVCQFQDSDKFFYTAIRGLNLRVGDFRLKVGKDVITLVDPRLANYDFDYGVIRGKNKLLGGQNIEAMVLVKKVKLDEQNTEDVTIVKCVFGKKSVGIDYLNLKTRKWEKREVIAETEHLRVTKVIDLVADITKEETIDFLKNDADIKSVNKLLPENGTSSIRVDFWSGGNVIWYHDIKNKYIYGCRTEGIFEDRNIDAEKGMVIFDGENTKIEDVTKLSKEEIKKFVNYHKSYYVGPSDKNNSEVQIVDLYDQHGCGTFTQEDKDYLILLLIGGVHDKEFFQNVLYNKPRKHDNI